MSADDELDVTALAGLVATEATRTPGVARLHPYVTQVARQAVSSAARRVTSRAGASGGAIGVDVDRDAGTGALTVTVRIVASTRPPVLDVVRDLQRRLAALVLERTGRDPLVVVNVLDVDVDADLDGSGE